MVEMSTCLKYITWWSPCAINVNRLVVVDLNEQCPLAVNSPKQRPALFTTLSLVKTCMCMQIDLV